MRYALGSMNGGVGALDADEPDTARRARRGDRQSGSRSLRRAFVWGVAMLCLGLSAGIMLAGLAMGEGSDPQVHQAMSVLQVVLFLGAAVALLFLLFDTGEGAAPMAGSASAHREAARPSVDAPAAQEAVAAQAAEAAATAEPAAEQRDPFAPLRENDAALLERLVMSTDRYDIVCEKLARRYMLSPRQAEVLNLLARGRNASYIEDKLCISLSTAKSHISGVYRKLGVHTQQELLAFVENAIDEADRKAASDDRRA